MPEHTSLTGRTWNGLTPFPIRSVCDLDRFEGLSRADMESLIRAEQKTPPPDPGSIPGLIEAAESLRKAVAVDGAITVIADYDVDGATSAAIMERSLSAIGAEVKVHIPHRVREGYGLGKYAAEIAVANKARTILALDCGTSDGVQIEMLRQAGHEVIVLDHHAGPAHGHPASILVNPNADHDRAADLEHESRSHCTAGLAWAVAKALGVADATCHALAAVGTICDVMTLTPSNRALVRSGLQAMQAGGGGSGLRALLETAGVTSPINERDLGWSIGPRLNAGGRIGDDAMLGFRLLASRDDDEAEQLAIEAERLNELRRSMSDAALAEALQMAADQGGHIVLLEDPGWHQGIVGIIAGRVREATNKPAFIGSIQPDGTTKGSARSVPGFDVGAALREAQALDILIKAGGHAQAAGYTQSRGGFQALKTHLEACAERSNINASQRPMETFEGYLAADADQSELVQLAEAINMLGPFGAGNAEPRFGIQLGRRHVGRRIGKAGVKTTGPNGMDVLSFRLAGTPAGDALESGAPCYAYGNLSINRWQGRQTAQLFVEDVSLI